MTEPTRGDAWPRICTSEWRRGDSMAHPKFDIQISAVVVASVALGIAVVSAGCGSNSHSTVSADRLRESSQAAAGNAAQPTRAEQKSGETKSVQPQVQTE